MKPCDFNMEFKPNEALCDFNMEIKPNEAL